MIGIVDCLTGLGGFIFAFARIWIEASVSRVGSALEDDGGLD